MDRKADSINSYTVTALANDLTRGYPRSPRETLGGYVIAARTLHKCRATLAGTAGEYHYDCPLDNFFFAFAEISADEFKKFVASGASDEAVAEWLGQNAKERPHRWSEWLRQRDFRRHHVRPIVFLPGGLVG